MLVLYDEDDRYANEKTKAIKDLSRKIVAVIYMRTDSYDKTAIQNWVKKEDGEVESGQKWHFNHHVPQIRIQKAIEDHIVLNSLTRGAALVWLVKTTQDLGIKPDPSLRQVKMFESRMTYELWADWAFSAICDWKQNIFYGPGSGDHAGVAKDNPYIQKQRARVKAAAEALDKVLPKGKMLDDVIPKEKRETIEGDWEYRERFDEYNVYSRNLWNTFMKFDKLMADDPDDKTYNPEWASDQLKGEGKKPEAN